MIDRSIDACHVLNRSLTLCGPITVDCPYDPKADDPQLFSGANDTDYQKCSDGMIFVSGLVCTCVENPRGITCIAIRNHWALVRLRS